jgi:phosphoribosylformylglycinamidine cyclo-ligase
MNSRCTPVADAPGGGVRYSDAGVDLDAAERAKAGLKDLIASTRDANTLSELGSFGGLYALPGDVRDPVLVASADGVGTKLKIAFRTGRHDTVGRDLVNHCVNDILVQGGRPLFFLDYLACGELEDTVVNSVVSGVASACRENGCALLGGETAQMPGFYSPGEYDLAGFVVGITPRESLLDGTRVSGGDLLVGIASTGLHTNGFSLAREIVFGRMGLEVDDEMPGMARSVGEVLLDVHKSYLHAIHPLLERGRIHALAHITGGGVPGNLPRTLPDGLGAVVRRSSWDVPLLFRILGEAGRVGEVEMDRVFNMGIGMVAIVAPADADATVEDLRSAGERAWILGRVEEGAGVRYES